MSGISAERQNILDVLQDHNQTMTRAKSPKCWDVPACNVRQLLFSMLRDGEVISPCRGAYSIAE